MFQNATSFAIKTGFLGRPSMSQCYEIIILEHLPAEWVNVFESMQVQYLPDGKTHLTGSLADQAALYGLLMRLRDFGLTLISVNFLGIWEEK